MAGQPVVRRPDLPLEFYRPRTTVAVVGTQVVTVSVEGELATVTLDRAGQLNAQTPQMWLELSAIGSGLPGSVRVVVVRGNGRAFSAGLDHAMFTSTGIPGQDSLADLAGLEPELGEARIAQFQSAFSWLARPDLISIAAVQGHAVGAGFQLALACDMRVLADDAQLTMAEVPLGLVPDLGGTRRLLELVGYSRALEICITGRRVGAAEAVAIGLANRCVPIADLDSVAEQTARALLVAPRNSMIEAKALLLVAASNTQSEQERAERSAQHRLLRELTGRFDG